MILPFAFALLCTPITLMISVVGIIKDNKHWRKYIFLLTVSVFLIAYSYNPTGNSDLVRYFSSLNQIKSLSLAETFDFFNDGLFVKNTFFWIISKVNNPHIIPAVTTSLVYLIMAYITCDFAELKGKTEVVPKILIIQFFSLQFISIINNVRNVSAFAIVALAFYLNIVKKRNDLFVWLLYILPIFIHPSAIVVVIFRCLSNISRGFLVILIIVIFFFPVWFNIIYNSGLISHLGMFISTNIDKMWWYINDPVNSDWSKIVASSLFFKLQRWTMFFLSGILIMVSFSVLKNYNGKSKFLTANILFNMSTIACYAIITPQYWRMSTLSVILSGPIIFYLFTRSRFKYSLALKWSLVICAVALLFIQIKLNTNSFNPTDYFYNILVNNVYVFAIKLIMGISGMSV